MIQKLTVFRRHAAVLFLMLLNLFSSRGGALGAFTHLVSPEETLYGLSIRYDIPVTWIIRANGLQSESIRIGQSLEIPIGGLEELIILPGDSLSLIAWELDVDIDELKRANGLTQETLRAGQRLRLPPTALGGQYTVRIGDTLSDIAGRFGTEIAELKRLNTLKGDLIHVGQTLLVHPPEAEEHRVEIGDTLWTIARSHGVDIDQIIGWNRLNSATIKPGQLLSLFPKPQDGTVTAKRASLNFPSTAIPRVGEYFYQAPDREFQPSVDYSEADLLSPDVAYNRAMAVFEDLDAAVVSKPALSNRLRNWIVIIDPGHGGLDPGAIVSVADGNGNTIVITEDEYVYDISLRLYRMLKRHGADVHLTILSPDHHIRDGQNPRQTFVNKKNEVYNDTAQKHSTKVWRPIGSVEGLERRKNIAAERLTGNRHSVFISIHADNSPHLAEGRALLFDGGSREETETSRAIAEVLASHLGKGAFVRQQTLRVLRNNPAEAAVLVEVRNIHYPRNAWALRSAELREQDAAMITAGILDWAER